MDRTDSIAQDFIPKECLEFSVSNARVTVARGSAKDRDHHSGRLVSVQHSKAGVITVFQLAASPPYLSFGCPQPAPRLPLHLPLTVPHLLSHLCCRAPSHSPPAGPCIAIATSAAALSNPAPPQATHGRWSSQPYGHKQLM